MPAWARRLANDDLGDMMFAGNPRELSCHVASLSTDHFGAEVFGEAYMLVECFGFRGG